METYQRVFDLIAIENLRMQVEHWLLTEAFVWSTLAQVIAAVAAFILARVVARRAALALKAFIATRKMTERLLRAFVNAIISVVFPSVAIALLGLCIAVAATVGWPYAVLAPVVNLLAAWIVIRLASRLIHNDFWSRVVAIAVFAVATLNILGLLGPIVVYLDQLGLRSEGTFLSVLDVLKGLAQLILLVWLALSVSRFLESQVQRAPTLTPSFKVLTGKLVRMGLLVLAVVLVLRSIGIDLTALAVFTGAVGVGVGFGLQKPISNLISGFILLLDRSIKPGEVVELGETFGWVTALNTRYVSVTTRDGKEWLIPNEELITQRVINWSFSDNKLRLPLSLGISYHSDVRLAMRLAAEAARESPRVLDNPVPVCRLMGFGNSSVDLELRIWITDPVNGVVDVRSEILLAIWDKFHAHGIEIPFPQRYVHVKAGSELGVTVRRRDPATNP